jgi:hypothetical protein
MAEIAELARALTGLPREVMDRMYAADRAEVLARVGKHIAGPSLSTR